ncbi:MAG: hypothetical protein QOJ29_5273 [Thermoleophilaceae bacterium]|nr:hypothetical protein [Thermoleophilaceae bacterium]
MHVHEHVIGAVTQFGERGVGFRERRARRFEVEHPGQVEHAQAFALALDDRVAAPRRSLRVVGRPHDPLVAIEQLVDILVPVGVVAQSDRVGAGVEQCARGLGGDPDAAGSVLPVHDGEVELLAFAQPGQQTFDHGPTGRADNIADEEDLHAS